MKVFNKDYLKSAFGGIIIGTINGMLGSGGGMIAVPVLRKLGFSQADAQANAIGVILPISVISAVLYILRGSVAVKDALIYIPGGIVGTLIGTFLLSKIPAKWLKKVFAVFMVWAGVRLLLK